MGDTLQAFRRSQVGQRERLSQQAIAGNTEAGQLLSLMQNLNEIEGTTQENRDKLNTEEMKERQKQVDTMRVSTFRLNVQEATQANLALRTIMKIGGVDATGMMEGVTSFVDGMTNTFANEKVKALFEGFGTIIGMTTVQPCLTQSEEKAVE